MSLTFELIPNSQSNFSLSKSNLITKLGSDFDVYFGENISKSVQYLDSNKIKASQIDNPEEENPDFGLLPKNLKLRALLDSPIEFNYDTDAKYYFIRTTTRQNEVVIICEYITGKVAELFDCSIYCEITDQTQTPAEFFEQDFILQDIEKMLNGPQRPNFSQEEIKQQNYDLAEALKK